MRHRYLFILAGGLSSISGVAFSKVTANIFSCEPNRPVLVCVYNGDDKSNLVAVQSSEVSAYSDSAMYYARIKCAGNGTNKCRVALLDDHYDCIDRNGTFVVKNGEEWFAYRRDGEWHLAASKENCLSQN